jgi:hypothetical protein
VIDWQFKLNQYLLAIDSDASEFDKIKFAANLLTGKALTWWRHKLTYGEPNYGSLMDFISDLYAQFVDTDHINRMRE